MLAAEPGGYLADPSDGTERIRAIVADDIRAAQEWGDLAAAMAMRTTAAARCRGSARGERSGTPTVGRACASATGIVTA